MMVSVLLRALLASIVWIALIEGDVTMVVYGAGVVPVVVVASYALTGRPARWSGSPIRRARALIGLVGWVLWRSVMGGTDVALRALRLPHPRIDPYWTTYRIAIESDRGKTVVTLLMNLIPGTLSASRTGAEVDVHVIGSDLEVTEALSVLESRVARVMGEDPSVPRE